jgi:Tfp pilus assembly protein FimV
VTADPVPAVAAEDASAATPVARITRDLRGHRFHVVRPGESLWSIASALLEPGASASSVARQVRRLWRLNRDRIGTGDPNLIAIGLQLRLR